MSSQCSLLTSSLLECQKGQRFWWCFQGDQKIPLGRKKIRNVSILSIQKLFHAKPYFLITWLGYENNFEIFAKKSQFRSSHRSCSIKKAVLKYFAIFTGRKTPVLESLCNKVSGLEIYFEKYLRKAASLSYQKPISRQFPVSVGEVLYF